MSKKSLQESIDKAEWRWLKPHALRGAVVLVESKLELLEVANEVANNNFNQVQKWIEQGSLTKPSPDQISAWDQYDKKIFLSIIVQPYVLIQEITQSHAS